MRGFRTITATLAHQRIDEHPAGRGGHFAPLAAAAFFGGADLVIDQSGHPLGGAQLLLHGGQILARAQGDAGGKPRHAAVPAEIVRHHDDPRHTFIRQLAGDLRHGKSVFRMLAAGHGNRVVIQQLVGNIEPHRHGGANGEQAGMVIGAIAQIRENMGHVGKGGDSGPAHALSAHMASQAGMGISETRHIVATNPGQGVRAFR